MRRHPFLMTLIALAIPAFLSHPLSAQEPAPTARPSIALVLQGGGALGFAHVGVIRVIEELGIPIDLVVGTSMGAAIGGFYALGYDAARLEEIALSIDWDDVFSEQVTSVDERYLDRIDHSRYFASIGFDRRGFEVPTNLLSGRKMLYYLDRLTLDVPYPTDFDSLPRRFRAVAADIETGERIVLDHGSLADAMRASMGIPGLLAPYRIGDRYLVDGGIVDNLPVNVARELGADLIIAVALEHQKPFEPESHNRNPLEIMSRTIEIMIRSNVQRQLPDADLAIMVDLSGYDAADYQKALEIIALGEEAADGVREELDVVRSKLGALPDAAADVQDADPAPILRVNIEGAETNDRDRARALFSPLAGQALVASDLEEAVAALEATGRYEFIRLRRTIDGSTPTLTATLQKHETPGHSLRLGIDHQSTYSGSTLSSAGMSSSVLFRGLITENSRLTINARILDSPALDATMVQPIGGDFFVEGLLTARQETEAYLSDSARTLLEQTRIIEAGVNLGANPVTWAEIAAGIRYQWSHVGQDPIIPAGDAMGSALLANVHLSAYQLDSPIFPTRGFSISSRYDQSLTRSDSSSNFRTLSIEGLLVPDFGVPISFALWGKAETDFSQYADASGAAPLYHKPRLSSRQFYPGPLGVEERIGSHIAGVGTEMKYRLQRASGAIGFPSFFLLQASQGTVLPNRGDVGRLFDFTHWTGTLGLGVRLNDGFGVLLRIGGTYGFDEDLSPFVALDLGSLGSRERAR